MVQHEPNEELMQLGGLVFDRYAAAVREPAAGPTLGGVRCAAIVAADILAPGPWPVVLDEAMRSRGIETNYAQQETPRRLRSAAYAYIGRLVAGSYTPEAALQLLAAVELDAPAD